MTDMETLLGEWGKTHFLLQRSKILKKEKKKRSREEGGPGPGLRYEETGSQKTGLCLRTLVLDKTSSPKRPRRLHQMAPLHPAAVEKGDLLHL